MTKQKKLLIILLSILFITAISFGVSYAFLINKDYIPNFFTVGQTIAQVKEEFTPPDALEPGTEFPKKPWVVNEGNLPCFVRLLVTFSDDRAEAFSTLDIDSDKWEKRADGYYYYKELLLPGKKTSPLFTKVSVKTEKENGDPYTVNDMIDFSIAVYSEAVHHTSHIGQNHPVNEYEVAWTTYNRD